MTPILAEISIHGTVYIMMTSSNGNIFRVTGHLNGEFPAQRPVTRSFDVFFDLRPNKQLSKQWWGWWFETPSWSLWRHRNVQRRDNPCVCMCLLCVCFHVFTRVKHRPVEDCIFSCSNLLFYWTWFSADSCHLSVQGWYDIQKHIHYSSKRFCAGKGDCYWYRNTESQIVE